jgi:hypothetical protein
MLGVVDMSRELRVTNLTTNPSYDDVYSSEEIQKLLEETYEILNNKPNTATLDAMKEAVFNAMINIDSVKYDAAMIFDKVTLALREMD